jgi:segregation and condensation protein A
MDGAGEIPFEEDARPERRGDALVLSLDSYEGPIEVLLDLARSQKIDLREISILQLVDQYVAFVESARELRLELAADWLVMAAWLALLKSRLLMPERPGETEAEETAEGLAFHLKRLDALKSVASALATRKRLGANWHARGAAAEGTVAEPRSWSDASLRDLLLAYLAEVDGNAPPEAPMLKPFDLSSVEEALARLAAALDGVAEWQSLRALVPQARTPLRTRSQLASHFVAALELAKTGKADIRQDEPFAPLMIRSRQEERAA